MWESDRNCGAWKTISCRRVYEVKVIMWYLCGRTHKSLPCIVGNVLVKAGCRSCKFTTKIDLLYFSKHPNIIQPTLHRKDVQNRSSTSPRGQPPRYEDKYGQGEDRDISHVPHEAIQPPKSTWSFSGTFLSTTATQGSG